MNKEIKLEKISYEELQDEYINESTTNYVLEKQIEELQQENKQLKEKLNKYSDLIKIVENIESKIVNGESSIEPKGLI